MGPTGGGEGEGAVKKQDCDVDQREAPRNGRVACGRITYARWHICHVVAKTGTRAYCWCIECNSLV